MILSLKGKRKLLLPALCALAVLAVLLPLVLCSGGGDSAKDTETETSYRLELDLPREGASFFAQFGWQISPEMIREDTVTIPAEFDEVYTSYNALQQRQGLDLTPYRGKTCRRFVWQIENYPREGEKVLGTVLYYDGKVIGGDISSARLDGFMTTFFGEDAQTGKQEASVTETASEPALDADVFPTD